MNDKRNVLLLDLLDWHIQFLIANNSRSQVTFNFRRENIFDFAGGRDPGGGGGVGRCRCFKHFLEYTYFSKLSKATLLGYYNHFYVFSFIRI